MLRGVVYVPDVDFFGTDQLHISVSDLGNSGKANPSPLHPHPFTPTLNRAP